MNERENWLIKGGNEHHWKWGIDEWEGKRTEFVEI